MINNSGEDKFMIIKIAGALIIFTAAAIFAIIQFTGTSGSVSTGGAFVSGEAFKQNSESSSTTKKPKMRTASNAMNKRDSIELFEKTNESYFQAQRKQAEAEEAERKARLMGKKTANAEENASEQKTSKTAKKKKTRTETVIPRMKLDKDNNGNGGAAEQGQLPAGMDMSSLQGLHGANGQPDQEQINKLIQNATQNAGKK